MGDINRDPELDRKPEDPRSDIQQAVESRADAAEAADGGGDTSPLEPAGVYDGVGGTAGEVKNQDKAQQ
jgi:hypothetical protein